jgi:hypothetical protein
MSKRTKTAQFRVTEEEHAHLYKAAADAGLKPSDYFRALTLHPTVVVVGEQEVVVVPSTITTAAADEALRARLRAILIQLKGQGESPEPGANAASMAPPAAPAPGSPPATPPSPAGGPDGMVGTSSSSAPAPSQEAAGADPGPSGEQASAPPSADSEPSAAGSEKEQGTVPAAPLDPPPGPLSSASPDAAAAAAGAGPPPPAGSEVCPHCGGAEGRHQSFCEVVRGEPPVPPEGGEATPQPSDMDRYVEQRVSEGELRIVAEAEWRNRQGGPPPQAPQQRPALEACPTCGTMKLPDAQCPDCGRRPGR